MQNFRIEYDSMYKWSSRTNFFTFPKWGKGDRRRPVDEDVRKMPNIK